MVFGAVFGERDPKNRLTDPKNHIKKHGLLSKFLDKMSSTIVLSAKFYIYTDGEQNFSVGIADFGAPTLKGATNLDPDKLVHQSKMAQKTEFCGHRPVSRCQRPF